MSFLCLRHRHYNLTLIAREVAIAQSWSFPYSGISGMGRSLPIGEVVEYFLMFEIHGSVRLPCVPALYAINICLVTYIRARDHKVTNE